MFAGLFLRTTPRRRLLRAGRAVIAIALILGLGLPAEAARRSKFRTSEAQKARETKIPPGQLHIIVSLRTQRISVYSDGTLAAQSRVSSGMRGHATPTGVFSVIQKNRHHRSNIYSGAPMPYMQRLTWSGIALHQGVLPGRPASHGCIRITRDFAQLLWKRTKLGARVIVTQDEVVPYAFSHPKLFVPEGLRIAEDENWPASLGGIRTASAETTAVDARAVAPAPAQLLPDYPPIADVTADIRGAIADENPNAKQPPAPTGPVSVFISRKERKLYVRQGFTPLFETLVAIRDHEKPFGTHVFTATETSAAGVTWVAVSLPVDQPPPQYTWKTKRSFDYYGRLRTRRVRVEIPAAPVKQPVPDAASVLERIDIPRDAVARIEALMGPGASLVLADTGLGPETGKGTDFIVLTR